MKGSSCGGVTYILKKSISKYVTIKQFNDSRILGLSLGLEDKNKLFLNVYLPARRSGDDDDYMVYLGKLSSIIADAEEENLCILGDFNCAPGSERYMDVVEMLSSTSMRVCDTGYFPNDTYTHVNAGSLSRTWLDHCAMSESLRGCMTSCSVTDDFATSDHCPLNLTLGVSYLPAMLINQVPRTGVKWDFSDRTRRSLFYDKLGNAIQSFRVDMLGRC